MDAICGQGWDETVIIRWRNWVRGDVENVNPKLLRRAARIARDMTKRYHQTGGNRRLRYTVYVNSGFRSRAEQQRLYDRYLRNGFPIAAPPGRSNHERSPAEAIDAELVFPNARRGMIARARLAKYGLKAPVNGEPWHIELV